MALDRNLNIISLPASADLSASQFCIVAIDANGNVALPSGSVGKVIGVLYNKPSGSGQAADVVIGGVVRCQSGGSIAPGDYVKSDAAGLGLTTTTTGNSVVGRAVSIEATGSGVLFEVQVAPQQL